MSVCVWCSRLRGQRSHLRSSGVVHHHPVPVQQDQTTADGQTCDEHAALLVHQVQRKTQVVIFTDTKSLTPVKLGTVGLLSCATPPPSGEIKKTHSPTAVISVLSFQTQNDFMVICNVAKILELIVPLMEFPSENFLTTVEEDLMKLIIKFGMTVRLLSYTQPEQIQTPLFCHYICRVCSLGRTTLCQLSWCRCEQGHAQLQVCLGLFQSFLW